MNSLESVPLAYKNTFPFNKLLLIRALKEDCLITSINQYIQNTFTIFHEGLENILKNSKVPIIFILKQSMDPSRLIQKLAKSASMDDKVDIVSLGKGQGDKAQKLIELGMQEGR